MKKTIFILLISIIFISLTAQEFEINKISEIAYAQDYRSPEGIQIIDNHLFFLNLNGLEIYEINGDGSITKLSVVTIPQPSSMVVYEQNCYIASIGYAVEGYHAKVYRIDISDTSNPEIIDQIEYDNYEGLVGLMSINNNLIVQTINNWNVFYKSYSLPEMVYLGQAIEDTIYCKVNDSLLVCQAESILYTKQYISHGNFELIGTTDVSAYSDDGYGYNNFKIIDDTLLVAVNCKNITFWDISDVTNWQYLSRYTLPVNMYITGNKQYAIIDENVIIFTANLIRLLDISDILNPHLVDTFENNIYLVGTGQACDYYGNNLYVGTINDGIQHYEIENNTIEYIYSYYDNLRFFTGFIYQDKIVAGNLLEGYQLFDIEDPFNPIDQGDWFNDKYFINRVHKTGGWMILLDYEEFTLEIYDITDLENPVLINTLSLDNYGFDFTYWSIDENDPFSFYLWNHQTNKFWKFDISEQGEPIELFEFDLPSTPIWQVVINSIAYATFGEYPYDLMVIDGLEENEPYLTNVIDDFSIYGYLLNQEGFLVSRESPEEAPAYIFQLDDPLQPELYFTPQFGSRIYIRDNLIFAQYRHIVAVYENHPNTTEPIAIFNGLNHIYNIDLIEYNGLNYLITIEAGNIGLFEYTYVPSSVNDELPKPETTLSNYPNPFNPETTIQFNTENTEENTEIVIYNIKGQRVKSFPINQLTNSPVHQVIWDGTDSNNKPVSSGIYMYQLIVDGKAIASKRCLLLK
ncbi:MAG: T9SS type A sorting domain-containing protein [Candidatus Cloacimonetes bacterium]|nr:T9SS type A sorting domain-containing protein [Candidatus Cloacimonadota bacterium]